MSKIRLSSSMLPIKAYPYRKAQIESIFMVIEGEEAIKFATKLAERMDIQLDNHMCFLIEDVFNGKQFALQFSDTRLNVGYEIIEEVW